MNEHYSDFSQLERDKGVVKPSRNKKVSSLLENLHFTPENRC